MECETECGSICLIIQHNASCCRYMRAGHSVDGTGVDKTHLMEECTHDEHFPQANFQGQLGQQLAHGGQLAIIIYCTLGFEGGQGMF